MSSCWPNRQASRFAATLFSLLASFSASLLRKTVVEIASPSLDGRRNWFDRPVLPNQEAAQEDTTTRWTVKSGQAVEEVTFETVDQMLRYIPTGSGAQWSVVNTVELLNKQVEYRDR